jgi:deoxyribodipyrimidine photo-lyase
MEKFLLDLNKNTNFNLNVINVRNDIEMTGCLESIVMENKVESIYFNDDYTVYSRKRDSLIKKRFEKTNVKILNCDDVLLLGKISPKVYQKFTPFSLYFFTIFKEQIPKYLNATEGQFVRIQSKKLSINNIKNITKLKLNFTYLTRPELLKVDSKILKNYGKTRNMINEKTTGLSLYIKFGVVSIREVYKLFKENPDLIKQLIWRDFYYNLAINFPESLTIQQTRHKFVWENNKEYFKLWCTGKTGFPLIDAGMRELLQTGEMHNRIRMLCANFLVKILKIDWRWGEKHFAQQLIDYDPTINNLNWQNVAGTHVSGQPVFRIFNPYRQARLYDPKCEYIKKWIPELKNVLPEEINGENLKNYIMPIVDFNSRRNSFLKKI